MNAHGVQHKAVKKKSWKKFHKMPPVGAFNSSHIPYYCDYYFNLFNLSLLIFLILIFCGFLICFNLAKYFNQFESPMYKYASE